MVRIFRSTTHLRNVPNVQKFGCGRGITRNYVSAVGDDRAKKAKLCNKCFHRHAPDNAVLVSDSEESEEREAFDKQNEEQGEESGAEAGWAASP